MVRVNFSQRPDECCLSAAGKVDLPQWGVGNVKAARGRDRSDSKDSELQRALVASAELQQSLQQDRAAAQERLCAALEHHNATVQRVEADGNCQFRALSLDLYGSEEHHMALRARVVEQLKVAPRRYECFVQEPYNEYIDRMSRSGQWGDNVTLQAASDALRCSIEVLTDNPDSELITVHPSGAAEGLLQQPLWSVQSPLCVAFESEFHYDAAIRIRAARASL